MVDLSPITDNELRFDLYENELDLATCRKAIKEGVTHYKNGESIEKYIKIGEEISAAIRVEMNKRGLTT